MSDINSGDGYSSECMWKELVDFRRTLKAPVDSMGCDRLARSTKGPARRFQVLVSLMLSSQTKDEITAAAMARLVDQFSSDFDHLSVLTVDVKKLASIIYPVGFYNRKAEYIQRVAMVMQSKYNGDIPDTVDGLCELPGVGPKMAHLAMSAAWGRVTGIGVDVHVHRISKRLGWIDDGVVAAEQARIALQQVIPRDRWGQVNQLLVGLGQTICLPRAPLCGQCRLVKWCKFGQTNHAW